MGARINYVFKQDEYAIGEPSSSVVSVVLYSHGGETNWMQDIAGALEHARPRWHDSSYCTRMIISYLTQSKILAETGFGIYAVSDPFADLGEFTVVIDLDKQTIHIPHEVSWDSFINAILSLQEIQ